MEHLTNQEQEPQNTEQELAAEDLERGTLIENETVLIPVDLIERNKPTRVTLRSEEDAAASMLLAPIDKDPNFPSGYYLLAGTSPVRLSESYGIEVGREFQPNLPEETSRKHATITKRHKNGKMFIAVEDHSSNGTRLEYDKDLRR